MAYMSQEQKAKFQPKIKALLKEYGLRGSLSVDNHSTIVLTIKSGVVDFQSEYWDDDFHNRVNTYHIGNYYKGVAREFLEKAKAILYEGNHDNSRAEIDYFDVGWYVNISIGRWNKPYEVVS